MNVKKINPIVAFIAGCILALVLCSGIFMGFYLCRFRPDRLSNSELREQLTAVNSSFESANAALTAVTDGLSECRTAASDSLDYCATIRDASQRIRAQIKILQDYYTNTGRLIDNCGNSDKSNEIGEE